jgi:hypothetical protein
MLRVLHLERRTVLEPRLAMIVDAGGGDVGVADPLLHLGDVGRLFAQLIDYALETPGPLAALCRPYKKGGR